MAINLSKTKKYEGNIDISLNNVNIVNQVLVIVPCFNEAGNIVKAINNLKKTINIDFLLVNDCSTDNTLEIIKKNKWNYISNEKNLGLSGSFRNGVKYAIDKGYRYVIQYDGDGQHNPEDIIEMIFYAQKGYDIIVTSRYFNNNNLTKSKEIAHKFLKSLFYLKTHQKITDPTCGLRLYNWVVMEEFLNNPKMDVEPSSIAYITKSKKLKIKEISTQVFNREHGEGSFTKKSNVIKYMSKQTFRLLFLSLNKSSRKENKNG